jgi:hypothetical protein
VTIAFIQTIPGNYTGPAEYAIDNIQLLSVQAASGARAGYCSATGDTSVDGNPIAGGTFLNLLYGQPQTDVHYTGATLANYVQGMGITCDETPAGYSLQGFVSQAGDAGDLYPYFAR